MMKRNEDSKRRVAEVKVGEMFVYGKEIYCKQSFAETNGIYNAVGLTSDEKKLLEDSTVVELFN